MNSLAFNQNREQSLANLARLKDVLMGYPVYPEYSTSELSLRERHRHWVDQDGVLGIGIGPLPNSKSGLCYSLIVYLHAKSLDNLIPVSVDAHGFGPIRLHSLTSQMAIAQRFTSLERPIKPGASISKLNDVAGTACVCVRKSIGEGRHQKYLLSCEHVLYAGFDNSDGAEILQPASEDSAVFGIDESIANRVGRGGLHPNGINEIDAAIARINPDIDMRNEPIGTGFRIKSISNQFHIDDEVIMYGRSSGELHGKITDLDVNTSCGYKSSIGTTRPLKFRNLVKCDFNSRGGDSGAPVLLNSTKQLIGLHIAGINDISYFCRIKKVFSKLQLSLP